MNMKVYIDAYTIAFLYALLRNAYKTPKKLMKMSLPAHFKILIIKKIINYVNDHYAPIYWGSRNIVPAKVTDDIQKFCWNIGEKNFTETKNVTSKLWTTYSRMVFTIKYSVHAKKSGDWDLHVKTSERIHSFNRPFSVCQIFPNLFAKMQ